MDFLLVLFIFTTALNGILAGVSFDVSLVKLPTRKKIGDIAYATFARGNDLGNGKIVYPILGIGSALCVLLITFMAYFHRASFFSLLTIASLTTILHTFGTVKAAPIMLSIKDTPNDEKILKKKFDQFERWHAFRTIFQITTFIILLVSLIIE